MGASDELKAKGNAAFSAGKFEEAIQHFTNAIAVDPSNHVLYSNRSAALSSLARYEEALGDAEKVVALKPDWGKGYGRKGAALYGLKRFDDAVTAYEEGLSFDSGNEQLKQGLSDSRTAASSSPLPPNSWGAIFSNPAFLARLAIDPRTKPLMNQPDFISMVRDVSTNPRSLEKYIGDDRFQGALQIALEMMAGSTEMAQPGGGEREGMEVDSSEGGRTSHASSSKKAPEPEPEPEVEMDEAEAAATAAKEAANKEKELGNAAYKKKEFDAAIEHYNKALELYDGDISFLTNRAAVKFEQGDFAGCIADCDKAVERGRELRADYKVVARAMTRKGNALVKQGELEAAIEVYSHSLTEHRNADTLKRLHDTEKALKDRKEEEYVDMDKCNEEKEKGNAAFKEQKYPEAVAHYTEALKRGPSKINPEAHKLYSNRAACYTKLGAWNEGLKDADECIRLAPDFVKGYSRKGHLQFFMKEFDKAMETYEAGLKYDPESAELKEGLMRCVQGINRMNRGDMSEAEMKERQAKGMADPEVQSILTDPIMRQVLADMQEDPKAAQKHLAHPDVARKIDKLVAAGVIQIR